MKARDSFPYEPEVDYESISPKDSEKVIQALRPFIKDDRFYIENHLTSVEALRNYINSTDQVNAAIRASFLVNVKGIDKCITKIILLCSSLKNSIREDSLNQKAMKEYYEHFSDNSIDDRKIEYIKLLKLYETTKYYNGQLKASWEWLREIFGNIEVASYSHQFLQQVLTFKIYPRLDLIAQVDLFVRRLSFILQISSEKESDGNLKARGDYIPTIRYSFSVAFNSEISEIIGQSDKTQITFNQDKKKGGLGSIDKNWSEEAQGDAEEFKNMAKSQDKAKESCIKDDFFIDCRCDEIFNQSYVHTLRIDPTELEIEELKIRKSVYIETHPEIEGKILHRELIRSFISSKDEQNKIGEYESFLDDFFSSKLTSLVTHFSDIPDDEKVIFMYHFSPVFFFKLVLHEMRKTKSGFIHRSLKDNQMVRELPFEYLKKTLGNWWDKNIFQKTKRIQRNSKEIYTRFVRIIAALWHEEQPVLLKKIVEDPKAKRAFHLHDLNTILPYVISEISYMFYLIYSRFLNSDFIYTQTHQSTFQYTKEYKKMRV